MQKVNFYIGAEFFREIRENNCYYIDKTAFIEEFLTETRPKVSLITRPRRFGKTLTMNMLKEFFDIKSQGKENIFEGLYISQNEELCKKWQNQYPVVYLTLKGCEGRNFEEAVEQISSLIGNITDSYPFLQQSSNISERDKVRLKNLLDTKELSLLCDSLLILSRTLYAYYGKKIIILIDEYDVPINNAYHYGFYEDIILFMRTFLGSALKGNEYLEFAVLTGCLRIAKESIFTGLNNFACFGISDTKFSNAIGFTSEEVDKILLDAGLEDKKPLFKEWYDGYTFGKQTEIYCPWDVSNYVAELQSDPDLTPKLYWNQTSGNTIIKDFLKRTDFELTEKFETLMNGGCVEITLSDQQTYNIIYSSEENFWNILYATGYLTKASAEQIKHCGKTAADGNCLLTIPNKEVWKIYKTAVKEWLSENIDATDKKAFFTAFWKGDAEQVTKILTHRLKLSISFRDYAENFYHAVLLGIFVFTNNGVKSNLEGGEGLPDLRIINKQEDIAAVIEVKYTVDPSAMSTLCDEALQQIKDKDYDYDLREDYDTIFHWGIAFYKKRCVVKVIKHEHCLRQY